MNHSRKAKPRRRRVPKPEIQPGPALKAAAILRDEVLPAVCVGAETLAAALALLPLTTAEMRDSSASAVQVILGVVDRLDDRIGHGLAALRDPRGDVRGEAIPTSLALLLKRRRLARAALRARLKAARKRPSAVPEGEPRAASRLSPDDWEFIWGLYLRPMLALEIELAAALDDLVRRPVWSL